MRGWLITSQPCKVKAFWPYCSTALEACGLVAAHHLQPRQAIALYFYYIVMLPLLVRQSTALLGMSLITLLGGHSDKEGPRRAFSWRRASAAAVAAFRKPAAELATLVAMLYDGACISGLFTPCRSGESCVICIPRIGARSAGAFASSASEACVKAAAGRMVPPCAACRTGDGSIRQKTHGVTRRTLA